MHRVNKLLAALMVIASVIATTVPALATIDTSTTEKVPELNGTGYLTVSNIDTVRINNTDSKFYEAHAPVIVSLYGIDKSSVEIRRYHYSDTSYIVNDDGSIHIELGYWDDYPTYDTNKFAKFGLYRILINPYEDDQVKIYINVTESTADALPTTSTVNINGKSISFDAYNIDGYNYFKLRDIASVLNNTEKQFEVGWTGTMYCRIFLTSGQPYTPVGNELTAGGTTTKEALASDPIVFLDNNNVCFSSYNIDGYNYFKLRDLASAIDFGVTWYVMVKHFCNATV